MKTAALILTALVGLAHVWFLILEMFLWPTPFGQKLLEMSAEDAQKTAVLAKNQGLYNGFLAAGLFWSLFTGDPGTAHALRLFFLGCVVVAGVYGAITASGKILVLQALPGALALGAVLLAA